MSFRHRFLLCMALIAALLIGFTCWALGPIPEPPPPSVEGPHP